MTPIFTPKISPPAYLDMCLFMSQALKVFCGNPAWKAAILNRATVVFGADLQKAELSANEWSIGDKSMTCGSYSSPFPTTDGGMAQILRTTCRQVGLENDIDTHNPATMDFFQDGSICGQYYYRDSRKENPAKGVPASVEYYPSGKILSVRWFKDDFRYDSDYGHPHTIRYAESGEITIAFNDKQGEISAEEARIQNIAANYRLAAEKCVAMCSDSPQVLALTRGTPQPRYSHPISARQLA